MPRSDLFAITSLSVDHPYQPQRNQFGRIEGLGECVICGYYDPEDHLPDGTVSGRSGHQTRIRLARTAATKFIESARTRQVTEQGYSADHDDTFVDSELINACISLLGEGDEDLEGRWPWEDDPRPEYDDAVERLAVALAFGMAELERLIRLEIPVPIIEEEEEEGDDN